MNYRKDYDKLEYCIFDRTDFVWHQQVLDLPKTHLMGSGDIALEKYYELNEPRPGLVNSWITINNFHIYDSQQRRMDLTQSGRIFEYYTWGVRNAYYYDFRQYIDTQNAEADIYLTRTYPNQWPPHP